MATTDLETRNIYPGEAVLADDYVLYRVQTFGSTSTFNSTDVFEIGNADLVEAVDDVPAVAITNDTNEYASLRNLAVFANKNPDTANYVNHLSYQDALVDMYAPIIRGKYYGLFNDEVAAVTSQNGESPVFRTMYMEDCAINSITATYTTGGLATENFALESDNKRWFFNNGSNIVVVSGTADVSGASGPVVPSGETGTYWGYYFADQLTRVPGIYGPNSQRLDNGDYALKVLVEESADNWVEYTSEQVLSNLGTGEYYADASGVYINDVAASGNNVKTRYIAPSGGEYFTKENDELAGMRHGQAEIYLFDSTADRKIKLDPSGIYGPSGTPFWRLTSSTITVPLGREALSEIGHFRPYARPLTLPVPATVAVESTDHDLELARRLTNKEADSEKEIGLEDFLKDKNLVVKLYRYTNDERNEISALLKVNGVTDPYLTATSGICPASGALYGEDPASGLDYKGRQVNAQDLYPMKVVCVKKLINATEAQSLAVGSNATQTFDFRADNCHWCLGPGAEDLTDTVAIICNPTTTEDVLQPYDYAQI